MIGTVEQCGEGLGPRVDVAGFGVQAVVVVDHRVLQPTDVGRDDRGAGRHCLEGDGTERFRPQRWDGDDVALAELMVDGPIVEAPEVGDAQSGVPHGRFGLQPPAVRPVAVVLDDTGDAKLDIGLASNIAQRLDHHGEPLLQSDPTGERDDRRITGVRAAMPPRSAEISDRTTQHVEALVELRLGVMHAAPACSR